MTDTHHTTNTTVRLAKRLAEQLQCSRSTAEQYIEGGFVTVNGVVVEEPQARVQNQSIVLLPGASLLALTPVTLLLHKPAGYESRDAANASGDARIKAMAAGSEARRSVLWIMGGSPCFVMST